MRLIDADKFIEKVNKDREHECYLHSWTADDVLERLDSWYAPTVEAIPKADYETRLKADLKAILTELLLEIEEMKNPYTTRVVGCAQEGFERGARESQNLIQQKINSLKEV